MCASTVGCELLQSYFLVCQIKIDGFCSRLNFRRCQRGMEPVPNNQLIGKRFYLSETSTLDTFIRRFYLL